MKHSEGSRSNKAYPFQTRRQIATRLQSDREFARECLEIMAARQVSKESGATAKCNGAWGWGSSDASRIAVLAQQILEGADTDGDWEEVLPVLTRYTKQLAQHFRERQLTANPGLADVAALYGVSVISESGAEENAGPLETAATPQATDITEPRPIVPEPSVDMPVNEDVPQLSPREASTPEPRLPPTPVSAVLGRSLPQRTPTEKAVIAYLARHERGTTTEIAERTRRDRDTVLETLRQLHSQGIVFRVGTGRGTFYSLQEAYRQA